MNLLKRLWQVISWTSLGYSVYTKLKSLDSQKLDLYNALPADQQVEWVKLFGDPRVPIMPSNPLQSITVNPQSATSLTQVAAKS